MLKIKRALEKLPLQGAEVEKLKMIVFDLS